MEYIAVLIVAALTFGVCFLFDKGFEKFFRNKPQHKSGLSVRVNKRYAAFGAILFVLGLAAIFAGLSGTWLLLAGGVLILVIGICLFVYYVTFGIFYDADSFVLTTFGKKSATYSYRQIKSQQLYTVSGNCLMRLNNWDGTAVATSSLPNGVYIFKADQQAIKFIKK